MGTETDNWYAELFVPTFTREDVVNDEEEDGAKGSTLLRGGGIGGLPRSYYEDVYTKVALEEQIEEEKAKDKAKVEQLVQKILTETKHLVSQPSPDETAHAEDEDKSGNIWTSDELKLFRYAYTKLKEKAVKLLCIIETKNLKIKEMKDENRMLKKRLRQKDQVVADLSKEKVILQGYAKSHEKISNDLEQKLRFYEDCNNELKDVVVQKQHEISKIKSTLQTEVQQRKQLSSDLQEAENEHRAALISIEESLKGGYLREIERLKNEMEELERSKRSADERCEQFKTSFLNLQQHFMHGDVFTRPPRVSLKESKKEFIGVADLP